MKTDVDVVEAESQISEEERQRRISEVDYARASVMLEGAVPHPEMEELMQQYITGELTSEELDAACFESIDRRHKEWMKKQNNS